MCWWRWQGQNGSSLVGTIKGKLLLAWMDLIFWHVLNKRMLLLISMLMLYYYALLLYFHRCYAWLSWKLISICFYLWATHLCYNYLSTLYYWVEKMVIELLWSKISKMVNHFFRYSVWFTLKVTHFGRNIVHCISIRQRWISYINSIFVLYPQ